MLESQNLSENFFTSQPASYKAIDKFSLAWAVTPTSPIADGLPKYDESGTLTECGENVIKGGDVIGLQTAIDGYSKIQVAEYQRNYTWSKEDVEDLFNDLTELVKSPKETHFLGSLILQDSDDSGQANECWVVDGQQRLTTVFLFVARIRDAVSLLGTSKIVPIDSDLLEIDVLGKARKFLYEPSGQRKDSKFDSNPLLRSMFLSNMLKELPRVEPPGRDSKLKDLSLPLRKAYWEVARMFDDALQEINDSITQESSQLGEDALKPLIEKEQLRVLNEFLDAITKRFMVLKVTTGNVRESLDVFMTLNARGVPLGPSDLVRGQVLENLSYGLTESEIEAKFAANTAEWKIVLDNLIGGDVEQFFRHFLVSTNVGKVTKKNIVDVATVRITDSDKDEQLRKTHDFWNELQNSSEAYKSLLQPDLTKKFGYHLKVLRTVSASYRVLLLTVFNQSFSLNEDQLADIVRLCYVLVFRYFGSGGNAQDLETFFAEQSHKYRADKNLDHLRGALAKKADIDFDVAKYLKEKIDSTNWAKAILHGIDDALRGQANQIEFDTTKLHLEHIAPQSSTTQWVLDLFNGKAATEEEYDKVIESLGNQTLLDEGINKAAKQAAFGTKKAAHYHKATLQTTRDLTTISSWTANEVDDRLNWLAETFDLVFTSKTGMHSPTHFTLWLSNAKAQGAP